MAKYRKKPVVIDAVRFLPTTHDELVEFFGGEEKRNILFAIHSDTTTLTIVTLEGLMVANEGDWIIKGVNGEYYPCKPDIFEKTYEKV